MRAALLRENVVAEAQNILLKCIYKLERYLNLDLIYFFLKIDRLVDGCLAPGSTL